MSDADYIGQQFGSYIIIEFINRGTFGGVYKAKHAYFEDDPIVAIKILQSHFGSDEERAQSITEAKLLRKLKHPHILPVMDVAFQNDVLYMIIQYAECGTLRNRINKQAGQPLPVVEAIKIVTQVGEALQYAHQHEQHVVHCDLKPENILFNATGDALLADFGIAVILGTTGTKLLSKGGTLGYMAPEQFKGLVSPKIDQYALGCIAYELFAGRHPYNLRGANGSVAEYQHSQVEPVAPSTYNPQLPVHIETAIKKAMAKDRNNRYSNIAAFLAALKKTAFSQPATQPVITQPSTAPVTSPDPIEQLFQEGEQEIAKQERNNHILMIVIGTLVLLGVVAEGVKVEVWRLVIGEVGVVITGAMAVGVIAGILATLISAIKDEDDEGEELVIGAWVVAVGGGGCGIVAGSGLVDVLDWKIIYGIIGGGGGVIATVVVYWATVVVSSAAYAIGYGTTKVVGAVAALIGRMREKS